MRKTDLRFRKTTDHKAAEEDIAGNSVCVTLQAVF